MVTRRGITPSLAWTLESKLSELREQLSCIPIPTPSITNLQQLVHTLQQLEGIQLTGQQLEGKEIRNEQQNSLHSRLYDLGGYTAPSSLETLLSHFKVFQNQQQDELCAPATQIQASLLSSYAVLTHDAIKRQLPESKDDLAFSAPVHLKGPISSAICVELGLFPHMIFTLLWLPSDTSLLDWLVELSDTCEKLQLYLSASIAQLRSQFSIHSEKKLNSEPRSVKSTKQGRCLEYCLPPQRGIRQAFVKLWNELLVSVSSLHLKPRINGIHNEEHRLAALAVSIVADLASSLISKAICGDMAFCLGECICASAENAGSGNETPEATYMAGTCKLFHSKACNEIHSKLLISALSAVSDALIGWLPIVLSQAPQIPQTLVSSLKSLHLHLDSLAPKMALQIGADESFFEGDVFPIICQTNARLCLAMISLDACTTYSNDSLEPTLLSQDEVIASCCQQALWSAAFLPILCKSMPIPPYKVPPAVQVGTCRSSTLLAVLKDPIGATTPLPLCAKIPTQSQSDAPTQLLARADLRDRLCQGTLLSSHPSSLQSDMNTMATVKQAQQIPVPTDIPAAPTSGSVELVEPVQQSDNSASKKPTQIAAEQQFDACHVHAGNVRNGATGSGESFLLAWLVGIATALATPGMPALLHMQSHPIVCKVSDPDYHGPLSMCLTYLEMLDMFLRHCWQCPVQCDGDPGMQQTGKDPLEHAHAVGGALLHLALKSAGQVQRPEQQSALQEVVMTAPCLSRMRAYTRGSSDLRSSAERALVAVSNRLTGSSETEAVFVPTAEDLARARAEVAAEMLPVALVAPEEVAVRLVMDAVRHEGQLAAVLDVMKALQPTLCNPVEVQGVKAVVEDSQAEDWGQTTLLVSVLRDSVEGLRPIIASDAHTRGFLALIKSLVQARLTSWHDVMLHIVLHPLYRLTSSSTSTVHASLVLQAAILVTGMVRDQTAGKSSRTTHLRTDQRGVLPTGVDSSYLSALVVFLAQVHDSLVAATLEAGRPDFTGLELCTELLEHCVALLQQHFLACLRGKESVQGTESKSTGCRYAQFSSQLWWQACTHSSSSYICSGISNANSACGSCARRHLITVIKSTLQVDSRTRSLLFPFLDTVSHLQSISDEGCDSWETYTELRALMLTSVMSPSIWRPRQQTGNAAQVLSCAMLHVAGTGHGQSCSTRTTFSILKHCLQAKLPLTAAVKEMLLFSLGSGSHADIMAEKWHAADCQDESSDKTPGTHVMARYVSSRMHDFMLRCFENEHTSPTDSLYGALVVSLSSLLPTLTRIHATRLMGHVLPAILSSSVFRPLEGEAASSTDPAADYISRQLSDRIGSWPSGSSLVSSANLGPEELDATSAVIQNSQQLPTPSGQSDSRLEQHEIGSFATIAVVQNSPQLSLTGSHSDDSRNKAGMICSIQVPLFPKVPDSLRKLNPRFGDLVAAVAILCDSVEYLLLSGNWCALFPARRQLMAERCCQMLTQSISELLKNAEAQSVVAEAIVHSTNLPETCNIESCDRDSSSSRSTINDHKHISSHNENSNHTSSTEKEPPSERGSLAAVGPRTSTDHYQKGLASTCKKGSIPMSLYKLLACTALRDLSCLVSRVSEQGVNMSMVQALLVELLGQAVQLYQQLICYHAALGKKADGQMIPRFSTSGEDPQILYNTPQEDGVRKSGSSGHLRFAEMHRQQESDGSLPCAPVLCLDILQFVGSLTELASTCKGDLGVVLTKHLQEMLEDYGL